MNSSNKYVLAVLALVVIAIGGAFAYRAFHKDNTQTSPTETDTIATTSTADGGISVSLDGLPEGATATIVGSVDSKLYESTPKPSLERSLPHGTLPADAHAILMKNRQTVVAEIQKNPAVMSNWMALGIMHKQVNDFEGARIYWNYVATVNSTNISAHWNLGTLYENYLKDPARAESEFKKVLALDATYITAYVELATMLQSNGNTTGAVSVLSDGLKKNPGALDLLIARAHLYRDTGNSTAARADYATAIALATKAQNTALTQTLTQERDAIQ